MNNPRTIELTEKLPELDNELEEDQISIYKILCALNGAVTLESIKWYGNTSELYTPKSIMDGITKREVCQTLRNFIYDLDSIYLGRKPLRIDGFFIKEICVDGTKKLTTPESKTNEVVYFLLGSHITDLENFTQPVSGKHIDRDVIEKRYETLTRILKRLGYNRNEELNIN